MTNEILKTAAASDHEALARADALDKAYEDAAFRAVGHTPSLPARVVRRRVKDLVGPFVHRAIQTTTPTTLVHGPQYALILQLMPFFKCVFVTICPHCCLRADFRRLMPLVERGLVIPILYNPSRDFPTWFLDQIAPFPHIPLAVFRYLGPVQMDLHERLIGKRPVCGHCHEKLGAEVEGLITNLVADRENRALSLEAVEGLRLGCNLTNAVLENLKARLVEGILPVEGAELLRLTSGIRDLADSVALDAVLTLERPLSELEAIGPSVPRMLPEMIGTASLQLGLTSSPDIPLDEHLKILEPHIGTCSSLIFTAGQPSSLEEVIERTRDISAELLLAGRSRRARVARSVLTIVRANPSLLTGLLGGAVGLSVAGLAGCGLGSAAGVVSSMAAKAGKVRLPQDAVEDLRVLLQPLSLQALESYYGLSREAAHIWSIRSQFQRLRARRAAPSPPPVLVVEQNAALANPETPGLAGGRKTVRRARGSRRESS